MASPDAVPYIDLVLVDQDPQDIVDVAVADIQTRLPDWRPREGNTEMVLLEGMAVQIAELVYAANRLPSSVVQVLLKLNGVEYDPGAQPTADVTFNLTTPGGTIPAGTSVRLDIESRPLDPLVLVTDSTVVAPAGVSVVTVSATGNLFTSSANGYVAGTTLALLDSLLNVESVELASEVTGGREAETNEEYFERGIQLFSRLTSTLVLPRQFVASMLEETFVTRAYVLDNYDPTLDGDNNGPVGDDPGHVTLVAYGEGALLSTEQRDDIMAKVTDLASAQLMVHFKNPTLVPIDVTVTIKLADGFVPSEVSANIQQALRDYLNPLTWNWSTIVRRNNLISVVSSVEGVEYVKTMTTPAADLNLNVIAPLVTEGTFSVTVELT